jgi:predicted transcriptional regulator of viral defense system
MERSLSGNEAKVILELEWRGQSTITLAELRRSLGASESYGRYLAHRLVRKGWLERLRPGLFQLVPADRGREGVADTNPLTAGSVLVDPYFYSFGTAFFHHGLTEQVFAEIYLACRRRRRPEVIRGKRYLFALVPERRFFGFQEVAVLGDKVQMASAERAVLDAIDRPRYAGGIGEVSGIVARAAGRVSWKVMIQLLRRWESSALVQRLGFFLDLHQSGIPQEVRGTLLGLLRPQSKVHLGSRSKWGTAGKLIPAWNVVENVPRDLLVSQSEQPKHWVTLRDRRGKK